MVGSIPKKVFTLDVVKPGEKCVQICLVLKDFPGAVAKTAKLLADAKINIKTGSTFYLPEYPNAGIWSSFVDFSKATKSPEEVLEELKKLDVVLDVRLEEPKPAPFESIHFPVLHATTRALILPIGMFWALWDGFERILQPSGLAAVLYNAGKEVGDRAAKRLSEMFNVEGKELVQAFAQAVKATGWGITEVSSIYMKKHSATIIVRECFEAVAWRKKPYNVCHWTRGYLAGYMSTVFGKPVEAFETKCIARGDQYCEFKIQQKI
jgi:predicted hydrocarbon binding protein/predicted amino acid-binding ACT domain protein